MFILLRRKRGSEVPGRERERGEGVGGSWMDLAGENTRELTLSLRMATT